MKPQIMWNASLLLVNSLSELLHSNKPNCKHKTKIEYHTDNHLLYDFTPSVRPRQDKHLQTENFIGLKEYQIANCLSKSGGSSDALLNTLKTKSIEFFWVFVYAKNVKKG